jgi:hypothetical protein
MQSAHNTEYNVCLQAKRAAILDRFFGDKLSAELFDELLSDSFTLTHEGEEGSERTYSKKGMEPPVSVAAVGAFSRGLRCL